MSNEAKDKKSEPSHFSEVPCLRKEILTMGLHFLLLGNYTSLHSKIEPAAINIYRDITKCLTCHGFFLVFWSLKSSYNFGLEKKRLKVLPVSLRTLTKKT